ncbi:thiosulfate sulfurtransferase/rhodanese-like domain-containing protein 3 [Hyaena hyaena]|uniref:thiosulfate sulfurtransferase/rhodanese-like domain-containing protein 3 n=1 Tax=Hyaena hyaena TaxID=95912 RepID=UPI001920A3F8|nr:thiosulfate sulfurtransferase/rhodanese-like domain-containing protein 3 [Hyaena hyaena]
MQLLLDEKAITPCGSPRFVQRLAEGGAQEPGAVPGGQVQGGGAGGGSGLEPGGRESEMVLPGPLLGSACRAILGSAEAVLWGLKSIKGSCHNFCTAVKDVTYKELKSLLNSRQITLIDVRERWEIVEYGKIPGSINIPLGEVGEALQMNPNDFKEKYNEVKPSKSDSLVFSCLAGVRSKKALDTAVSLGFNSVRHYAGGWNEWATYEFSEKKKGN